MGDAFSVVVLGTGKEPILFAGIPSELAGQVELYNPHNRAVALLDAGIKDESGKLKNIPARQAVGPAVLRPEQQRTVPLSIALDPTTPPGQYKVEVDLMGQKCPALLHVVESFALRVRPGCIWVTNDPNREQRKQLVVTNEGNVVVDLGDMGEVELRDDAALGRDVGRLIQELIAGAPSKTEDFIASILATAETPRAGSLSARIIAGGGPLRPGETRTIEIEVALSPGLPVTGRYRGRAAVLTENVDIVVISSSHSTHRKSTHAEPRGRK